MNKKFNCTCPKYDIKVNGYIEYKYCGSNEEDMYTKGHIYCNEKDFYHCRRNNCPIWNDAQQDILG